MKLLLNLVLIFFIILNLNFSNCQTTPTPYVNYCPQPFLYRYSNTTVEDYDLGYQYIAVPDTLPPVLHNCLLPCQSMFFTDDSWSSFNKLIKSMGTVAFVCSSIVMIIFGPIFNRKFFKFDRHTLTIFFFAMGTFFIGVSDLMFVTNDVDLVCPESHRYARQTDKKCATNGVLYQFGWLSSICWFAFLSIDNFLRAAGKKTSPKVFAIIASSIWAVVIALSFGPMGGDQYGAYPVGQINCWILEKNWQYGFFWAELIVSLAVAFVGICLTIFNLLKKTDDGNKLKFVPSLVFIILIFCQVLYMIVFYGIINKKKDSYTETLGVQINCIFTNVVLAAKKLPLQTCNFTPTITFSSQYAFLFFIRFLGIQLFAVYVFSREALLILKSSFIATKLGFGDKDAYDIELE